MMKVESKTVTSRCDTCGRGFCQGNEPCPTEHEPTRDQIGTALRMAEMRSESARFEAMSASFFGADRMAVAMAKWDAAQREVSQLRSLL